MDSRGNCFPVGLRVLVVDDDPEYQRSIEKKLTKWKYHVTICTQAQDAVNFIQKGKQKFDILISETKVRDMDGFKFVEQVRCLNNDLPVILMSADDDYNMIKKGVESGACDFLLKTVTERELRLRIILQHLHTKKKAPLIPPPAGRYEECSTSTFKRKPHISADFPSVKKNRVTWTKDLHGIFVEVVNQIGLDAGPKKILESMRVKSQTRENVCSDLQMRVKSLTRENISSHLQKYRVSLVKEEKKKKLVADNGGTSQSSLQNGLVSSQNCVAPGQEERVGFRHSISYNHNTRNGGAATPSQFMPQQCCAQLPPDSHTPGSQTKETSEPGKQYLEFLLNNISYASDEDANFLHDIDVYLATIDSPHCLNLDNCIADFEPDTCEQ